MQSHTLICFCKHDGCLFRDLYEDNARAGASADTSQMTSRYRMIAAQTAYEDGD